MKPSQYSIDSDYSEENFDEFITALHSIEELAGQAVVVKDGLFWSHDLMSQYYVH
jgi:predicted regulator of Ras-like GTPase activity (Roadblock/LC7/MglB family)